MTRRPSTSPVQSPIRFDWVSTFARMEVGDKLLIHDLPQARVGSACADYSRNGKRLVRKKVKQRIYAIRVS